jgi:hypothetical protein
MEKKGDAPADLRSHPRFGTDERPHACSQVEARSRGERGYPEGDPQEGDSNCASVQQGRSAIPAGWKRPPSRLSDDQAALADECPHWVRSGSRATGAPSLLLGTHQTSAARLPGVSQRERRRTRPTWIAGSSDRSLARKALSSGEESTFSELDHPGSTGPFRTHAVH